MMAGIPVIVNRELKNAKLVSINDFGYIVTYNDSNELRHLFCHIIVNPAEAKRKGANGRLLYEKEYNWALQVKKIIGVLDEARSKYGFNNLH